MLNPLHKMEDDDEAIGLEALFNLHRAGPAAHSNKQLEQGDFWAHATPLIITAITEHLAPYDILAARNVCRTWRAAFGAHWSRVVVRIPGADHVLQPHKLYPHPLLVHASHSAQRAQRSATQISKELLGHNPVQCPAPTSMGAGGRPAAGLGLGSQHEFINDGQGGDNHVLGLSPDPEAAAHSTRRPQATPVASAGAALVSAFPAVHSALIRVPGGPCGPGARAGSAVASVYAHIDQAMAALAHLPQLSSLTVSAGRGHTLWSHSLSNLTSPSHTPPAVSSLTLVSWAMAHGCLGHTASHLGSTLVTLNLWQSATPLDVSDLVELPLLPVLRQLSAHLQLTARDEDSPARQPKAMQQSTNITGNTCSNNVQQQRLTALSSALSAGMSSWVPQLASLRVSEHSTAHTCWAEPVLAGPLLTALPHLTCIEAHPGAAWLAQEVSAQLQPAVYQAPAAWSLLLECGARSASSTRQQLTALGTASQAPAAAALPACTAVLHGLYADISNSSRVRGAEVGMDVEQLLHLSLRNLPHTCTPASVHSAALHVPGMVPALHSVCALLRNLTTLTLVLARTACTAAAAAAAQPPVSQAGVATTPSAGIAPVTMHRGHTRVTNATAPPQQLRHAVGMAASEYIVPLALLGALTCLEVLDPHQGLWWGCGGVSAALACLGSGIVRLRLQLADWRQLLSGEQATRARQKNLLGGDQSVGLGLTSHNSQSAGDPDDARAIDVGLRAAPLVLVPWHEVGALTSLRHLELVNGEPGHFSVTGLQLPSMSNLTHLTLDGFTLRHWGWEGSDVDGGAEAEEAWEEECDAAIEEMIEQHTSSTGPASSSNSSSQQHTLQQVHGLPCQLPALTSLTLSRVTLKKHGALLAQLPGLQQLVLHDVAVARRRKQDNFHRYDPVDVGVLTACCPDLTRLVYTHQLHGGRLQQGMCDARLTHLTRLRGLQELKVVAPDVLSSQIIGSAPGLGAVSSLTALQLSPGADWGPFTPLSLTQLTQLSSCHLLLERASPGGWALSHRTRTRRASTHGAGGGRLPTPWQVRDAAKPARRRHSASEGVVGVTGRGHRAAHHVGSRSSSDGWHSGGAHGIESDATSDEQERRVSSTDGEQEGWDAVVGLTHARQVEPRHLDTARLLATQAGLLAAELAAGLPARCDVVVRWLPVSAARGMWAAPNMRTLVHREYLQMLGTEDDTS